MGLRVASYITSIISIAYLVAGIISAYNWVASIINKPMVLDLFARPSLGDTLLLLAVGLLALPSPVFLRRGDAVKAIASIFVSSLLAVSGAVVELLAQLASIADAILSGETPPALNPYNSQLLLGIPMAFMLAWSLLIMARRERLEAILEQATRAG